MNQYLSISENSFFYNNAPVILRGAGLGNWLNLEHFLFGLPGTDSQIRKAIIEVYGKEQSDIFWNTFYNVSVTEEDFAFMQSCGFNSVRIPINYKLFYDNTFEQSTSIQQINRILTLCKKYSLWAILDLHSAPGGQNPDWHCDNETGKDMFWTSPQHINSFIELWKKIAEYYKDNTTIGGFDIINEPNYFHPNGDALMIDFYTRCTKAIRSVNKHHIIFYEGNTYSRDFRMFTENLDELCAYTFHLYPFLQLPNSLHSKSITSELETSLLHDVSFEHLTKVLKKPLWCGETGHPLHLSSTVHVFKNFIELLEYHKIGWSVWPLKDCGAMALLGTPTNGSWKNLTQSLSNNWVFWNIFTQDSILSAQKEHNPYSFYESLAHSTSNALQDVRTNLQQVPYNTLLDALQDFAFHTCSKNSELLACLQKE